MSLISTWAFSQKGLQKAAQTLSSTNDATQAVVSGIEAVELDPSVTSAGYGGLPNADGILQLDAALMTSNGTMGSVLCLEGFASAIPIAHAVLQYSPHSILGGAGATQFALARGFRQRDRLLTEHARRRYAEFQRGEATAGRKGDREMGHTDTVGMIVRDEKGRMTAGCASSGMEFKTGGRVGDSGIFGAGVYASEAGGAVATGDGDKMMRFCMAFLAVEKMSEGMRAEEACSYVVKRVQRDDESCQAGIVAMESGGDVGVSCTNEGFTYVILEEGEPVVKEFQGENGRWKHTCV